MFHPIEPPLTALVAASHAWDAAAGGVGMLALAIVAVAVVRRRAPDRAATAPAVVGNAAESLRHSSAEPTGTRDVERVARDLLDELGGRFGAGFAGLALVSDDGREGSGFLARAGGRDLPWWRDMHLDLEHEPSGIASAAFEAAAFTVYDVPSSDRLNALLCETVGAKSAAYVPVALEGRVIAVVALATTDSHRAFSAEDLALVQALASAAAAVFEQARTAIALHEALERERVLGSIAGRLRSESDLGAALTAAAAEIGSALGASRCVVQVGDPADGMPVEAEWHEPGLPSPGAEAGRLGAATRAATAGVPVTVSVDDDAAGEDREAMERLGSALAVAVPVPVLDRFGGALSVHRAESRPWRGGELSLLAAAAGEIGLAVRVGRLLAENRERLARQGALLEAAQALSGGLELPALLARLADHLAGVLEADSADCYLLDRERGVLRCVAVHGLDSELLGFEFASGKGLAGLAIREGRPVSESARDERRSPVPHPAYDGLADAIVAPLRWSGEVQGVLGAARRDGRPFVPADANTLETFAGLASLALRNAEAYTQSSRQARVQRGFYRIMSMLGQPLSRSATLEAVAQAAAETLDGTAAAVLVRSGARLAPLGAHELPAALGEALAESPEERDGAFLRAAAQGRILAVPELAEDERVPAAWRSTATAHGFQALLSVPVETPRADGDGIVLVFFAAARTFTEDDIELARHLADAARGALERSGLFEAERNARSLAQQLSRTGRMLTSELDPAAVLDEVVRHAPGLVGAQAAAFRLLERDELVVTAVAGRGGEQALGSRSPAGSRLSGDVFQSGAPVAVGDTSGEQRLRALDPMLVAGYAAFLGVPVAGPEGEPLGVLAVYASLPRTWREEETEALLALSASTSAALSNAELYQRVALERERSVAILASIADGIVAVDGEGAVVLWNAAAERITGVAAADALGRTPAEVLRRDLDSPGVGGNRLVPIVRGHEDVWLSVTEAVMRDPAGSVAGRVFAFRDISGDRLVEQLKSDFVSTVSHELRTPLTSIYGFAETLLRQDVMFGEEERKTFLGYIASESQRLTTIVDTLLNVARLDTGDLEVDLAETDVRDVVGQVLETAREGASNGHRFVVDLPEGPLPARADPEKLRQVCTILLDNALRYSPGGGTVTVGVARKRDTVEVTVADEGVGIPRADQEQIFRKFYRGTDAELRGGPGGTGLGLYIARELVTAMGGRIWVTSNEGEGSRFSFELPVVPLVLEAEE